MEVREILRQQCVHRFVFAAHVRHCVVLVGIEEHAPIGADDVPGRLDHMGYDEMRLDGKRT